jgi:ribose transport system permease protein
VNELIEFCKRNWSRLGLLLLNLAFWLLFAAVSRGKFLDDYNLFTLLRFASIQIVIGFAQMLAMTAGEMNLSVGAIGGLMSLFLGGLMEAAHIAPFPAVIICLIVSALVGMANGLLITGTGINSFVITLATSSIFTGIMFVTTQGNAFSALPANFVAFGKVRLFDLPISPLIVIMLVTTVILFILYRNTALGREILAVGANRGAARMSGVRSSRVLIIVHTLSGALAGLAAVMTTAMLGSAVPATGTDWLMPSFVAPALGGTLMAGGNVVVFGTVLGGLLLGTLNVGILMLNISNFWLQFFLGWVLLAAIGLDRLRSVYSERIIVQ